MASAQPLKPDEVEEGMAVLVMHSNPEIRGTVAKRQGMRASVIVLGANGETRKKWCRLCST
eukprot:COSAG02_NODE_18555_length_932_cov_2.255702_1_plen_61_part_00